MKSEVKLLFYSNNINMNRLHSKKTEELCTNENRKQRTHHCALKSTVIYRIDRIDFVAKFDERNPINLGCNIVH